jgi:hypothetical protein
MQRRQFHRRGKLMVTFTDIPRHIGGAEGVKTDKAEHKSLVAEWARRNHAEEIEGYERLWDHHDQVGEFPNQFDEALDLLDERERRKVKHLYWRIKPEAACYDRADQELMWIVNLYQNAVTLWHSRYQRWKDKLIRVGYSTDALASVPEPPPEVPLLHLVANGCSVGAIWQGNLGEDRYPRLFCQQCGWIQRRWFDQEPITPEMLHDKRPVTLPADPNHEEFRFASGGDEISKEEQDENLVRTRRCLKAAGVLISVSEAATMLQSSTQNVSNYIAKHRLLAWPDPDGRYRLVLRREVEALK